VKFVQRRSLEHPTAESIRAAKQRQPRWLIYSTGPV